MKRWLAAAAGLFGLFAYLGSRRRPAPAAVEPADELRARLTASRAAAEPAESATALDSEAAEASPDAVNERRQDVHERARAALDELGPT